VTPAAAAPAPAVRRLTGRDGLDLACREPGPAILRFLS
jgi:hypothetical protein